VRRIPIASMAGLGSALPLMANHVHGEVFVAVFVGAAFFDGVRAYLAFETRERGTPEEKKETDVHPQLRWYTCVALIAGAGALAALAAHVVLEDPRRLAVILKRMHT
jgi:hypothetical protein